MTIAEIQELQRADADYLRSIALSPYATVEFIDRLCKSLSDDRGEVYARIGALHGKPIAELRRIPSDQYLPALLRRQSAG